MQRTVRIGTLIPATAGPELLLDRPKCQAGGRAPASVGLEGRGHEEGQLRGRHPQVDSEHLASTFIDLGHRTDFKADRTLYFTGFVF